MRPSQRTPRNRQPHSTATAGSRRAGQPPGTGSVAELPCRVRLRDGRVFSGELPASRHRALQLGMLHSDSEGLVEIPAGRPMASSSLTAQGAEACHYLPGGAGEQDGPWLEGLLEHPTSSSAYAKRREEVFDAPAVRSAPRPDKRAVEHTRWLWVDVDKPGNYSRCGRCSQSAPVTCSWKAPAPAAYTPTGGLTGRCPPCNSTSARAS